MNSGILYQRIEVLRDWLRDRKYESEVKLPQVLSWLNLERATGIYLPSSPGFYIARLRKPPKGDPNIVYIGESDSLKRRIGFLRGAIRSGTAPHSGGKRLRQKFGADLSQFEICWLETDNVYIAKLFERYLILSFYEENRQLPKGNSE